MNTTTVLPLEKKDDYVDVELSYQKTNTITTTKNNKNENKRINKMVLFGGIVVAMTVGGAVVATATSKSKLLTNTTTGDKIAVVSSSYTCKQTSSAPWSGVSYGVAGFDGKYQTCWKNGPNDFDGNCYTNNIYSTSGSSPLLCGPKGRDWQTTSNHRVTRATCGSQCTSVVTLPDYYNY